MYEITSLFGGLGLGITLTLSPLLAIAALWIAARVARALEEIARSLATERSPLRYAKRRTEVQPGQRLSGERG